MKFWEKMRDGPDEGEGEKRLNINCGVMILRKKKGFLLLFFLLFDFIVMLHYCIQIYIYIYKPIFCNVFLWVFS